MMKLAVVLFVIGACAAFPAEDEVRPPVDLKDPPPEPIADRLEEPIPTNQVPPAGETDLKTDNTFWWGRSYYPVYRSWPRYYYRPHYYHRYYSPYWW